MIASIWADANAAGDLGEAAGPSAEEVAAADVAEETAPLQAGGRSSGVAGRPRQGRRIEELGRDPEEEFELAQDARDDAEQSGTLGELRLVAPRRNPRQQMLTTVGDILQFCRDLVAKQVERALDLRDAAKPNEQITGDALVRTAFQTLLPNATQRQLFLETVSNPKTWPRVKPLFGAPPYHFAGAGCGDDAGRHLGVGRMNYTEQNPMLTVTNIAQFGVGQLWTSTARAGDRRRRGRCRDGRTTRSTRRRSGNVVMRQAASERGRSGTS